MRAAAFVLSSFVFVISNFFVHSWIVAICLVVITIIAYVFIRPKIAELMFVAIYERQKSIISASMIWMMSLVYVFVAYLAFDVYALKIFLKIIFIKSS